MHKAGLWIGLLGLMGFGGCTTAETGVPEPAPVPCFGETDCAVGESCVAGFCGPRQSGCTSDGDCSIGEICEAEACRVGCRLDDQCLREQSCDQGLLRCVDLPPCGGPCPDDNFCDPATDTCQPRDVGCANDDACPDGQICQGEDCVAGCRQDGDCGGDQICRDDLCVPDMTGCQGDGDCDPGQICQAQACVPGCRGDADCPQDQVCEQSACVLDGECDEDLECGLGQICEAEVCLEGCRDDAGCASSQRCLNQSCVCRNDTFEPNDDRNTASRLSPGTTVGATICPDDLDHFAIQIAASCDLEVTLSSTRGLGDLDLQLRDDMGGLLVDATEEANAERASFRTEGPQTIIALVFGTTPAASLPYTLTVEVNNCQGDVGAEDLIITEVFYDAEGGDDGLEWIELKNTSDQTINLAGFSIGSGGTTYTTTKVQLAGSIPPGGCFVVGGSTSTPDNANPTFDQLFNFDPDLQNSGDTADGVALFDVLASALNASSVPIDAVLYGSANISDLPGPDGQPSPVHVSDVPSGSSIERTATGWRGQSAPSPNDCAHASLP